MIILFDADSLVYQAMYKVVTLREIRELYNVHNDREQVKKEIVLIGEDRFEKMAFDIFNEIEERYTITEIKYFFTKCVNNFKKVLDPTYKANRKSNKWVGRLRDHLIWNLEGTIASDTYEADDLIYFNTQLLNVDEYIVVSIDKDLKQIEGLHFDYYQVKIKDSEGNYIYNEFGKEIKMRKGFDYVMKHEGEHLVYKMLLTGDNSDNIKGVYGIGEKKAEKILYGKSNFGKFIAVAREYQKHGQDWKQRLKTNIKLIKFE
jgi:5'-3' exonuclease